ncbi:hypothetical protein [Jatrophihabitans sp.]|uniref:hypothetical protein n=1 Tax=Jatrophihabitans sp. TaxID=1932789 RepID=UPI0030C73B9D|nr:hypothetical protein [Jatrophihabitans sp.]
MPEIEFIDPDPRSDPSMASPRRPRDLGGLLGALPPLLCVLGAAAAVAAPFQYTIDIEAPDDGIGNRLIEHIDGWGRVRASGVHEPAAVHQLRYGFLLCVCAGLLLVAALAFGAALLRSERAAPLRSVARGLALTGMGGLAAVAGAVYLDFLTVRDSLAYRVSEAASGAAQATSIGKYRLHLGGCLWFDVAAAALALLSTLVSAGPAQLVARFRAEPQPEPGPALYAAGWPDGGDVP